MTRGRAWAERTLFVHNQRVDFPVKYKEFQVLTERWRLDQPHIERRGGRRPPAAEIGSLKSLELYDIRADPGQRENIAGRHPETVAELLRGTKLGGTMFPRSSTTTMTS